MALATLRWWWGLAAIFGACSQRSTEPTAGSSAELKLRVGDELDVAKRASTYADTADRLVMACGPGDCVVAYTTTLEGTAQLMVARFGTSSGQAPALRLLDDVTLTQIQVSANDKGEYLITWSGPQYTKGLLFNSTTSTVQDLGNLVSLPNFASARTFSNGEDFLLAYQRNGAHYRLLQNGVLGAEKNVSFAIEDAAPGPGQYLLVGAQSAQRIDSVTGAALDSSALVVTKYPNDSEVGETKAAYVGGTYVIAWSDHYRLNAARLRASDGALLDPDDDFNQASKVHNICDDCDTGVNLTGVRKVVSRAGEAIVSFFSAPAGDTRQAVKALRVDPATGELVAGSTKYSICTIDWSEWYGFDLGTGLGACVSRGKYQLLSYAAPFYIGALPGEYFASSVGLDSNPSVASDGENFAVAWQHCSDTGACGVRATRVDAATGNVLDSPAIQISTTSDANAAVAIAGSANGYLVSWSQAGQISARALSRAGQLGATLAATVLSSPSIGAVCNDARCLVTWLQGGTSGPPAPEARLRS